jgi:hypothetical protein
MDRRKVLGYLSAIGLFGYYGNRFLSPLLKETTTRNLTTNLKVDPKLELPKNTILVDTPKTPTIVKLGNTNNTVLVADSSVVDYLYKIKHFENDFKTDIFLDKEEFFVLKRLSRRLNRAQKIIGYMNFSILDFPMLIKYSKNYPAIGKFTDSEVALVEELVFRSATEYGFFGDKLIYNINDKIPKQHLSKMSNSGQYLYKSQAQKLFKQIQDEVGEKVILTSGVRGLMKQLQLFAAKAVKTGGNLSRASRSLAPPGHSYHGVGDFDIGDIGLGKLNFTEKFSETDIYKKLVDLGFIKIRYDTNNKFGVRYEPWHIKVS